MAGQARGEGQVVGEARFYIVEYELRSSRFSSAPAGLMLTLALVAVARSSWICRAPRLLRAFEPSMERPPAWPSGLKKVNLA